MTYENRYENEDYNIHWLNRYPDVCHPESQWDTASVQELLAQELVGEHDPVFLVSGRHHASPEDVEWVYDQLPIDNSLLIITSDEEGLFPYQRFMDGTKSTTVWCMTPTLEALDDMPPDVILGEGVPFGYVDNLRKIGYQSRSHNVFFSGQITHSRREEMWTQLCGMTEADPELVMIRGTGGFAQGLQRFAYATSMSRAKVAPSPAGPCTADSFRTYEALTAGCLPIVDDWSPRDINDPIGWWERAYPGHSLWPIRNWDALPAYADKVLADWPRDAVRSSAWWSQERARLRHLIRKHTSCQGAPSPITILVSVSPCQKHPSVDMIRTTVESALELDEDAEVLIVADGIRPEQEHLRQAYEEHLHHVAWLCNVEWERAQLLVSNRWRHQAGCVKWALNYVYSPMILFLEHDTPLIGEINLDRCERIIRAGEADVIRFIHEFRVLPDYDYLMLGNSEPFGLRMIRTVQWSQRPHLALTAYYREIMSRYFGEESRTFIEDVMHGVVRNLHLIDPWSWNRHKIWIYAEKNRNGSIQRSTNLDGRGDDEKAPVVYAYDGATPDGAPAPSAGRTG